MADKKTFLYQADAVAFGGKITLPFQEVLEGQATCSLSINGGYSQASVENYRFKNFFSFESARSQVIGNYSPSDDAYFSMGSVCIEKINILDMITCDRIISRVAAKYSTEDTEDARITTAGCSFENLRVAGKLLDVKLANNLFDDFSTYKSLSTARGKEALSSLVLAQSKGPIAGYTLVSNDLDLGFNQDHVLEIPHFGTLRLGRLYCAYNARRVSMLEVTLGCPGEGDGNFGGAAGGGDPYP
jgi:hypothetical protein